MLHGVTFNHVKVHWCKLCSMKVVSSQTARPKSVPHLGAVIAFRSSSDIS